MIYEVEELRGLELKSKYLIIWLRRPLERSSHRIQKNWKFSLNNMQAIGRQNVWIHFRHSGRLTDEKKSKLNQRRIFSFALTIDTNFHITRKTYKQLFNIRFSRTVSLVVTCYGSANTQYRRISMSLNYYPDALLPNPISDPSTFAEPYSRVLQHKLC